MTFNSISKLIFLSFFLLSVNSHGGDENMFGLFKKDNCYEESLKKIHIAIDGYKTFQDFLFDPDEYPLTDEEIGQIKFDQFNAGQSVHICKKFPHVAARYWEIHFIINSGMIDFPINPEKSIDPLFNISDDLFQFAINEGYEDQDLKKHFEILQPSDIWRPEKVALHAASAASIVDNDEFTIRGFEKAIRYVNHPYASMADFANYGAEVLSGTFYSPASLQLAEYIFNEFESKLEGHDRVDLMANSNNLARVYDFIHFVFYVYGDKGLALEILEDLKKSGSSMAWRDEDRFFPFMAMFEALK